MKALFLTSTLFVSAQVLVSQTNYFPGSGNVSVGAGGSSPSNYLLQVKSSSSAGYNYNIVSDVNHDQTHALKVIQRDYHGIGQSQETFGVYGKGQTIISTKYGNSRLNELINPQTPANLGGWRLDAAFLVQDVTPGNVSVNFMVFKTGKTVIGPTTSWNSNNDAMLSVDGKVVCKEVIVTASNWADFVFKKDYKLMPLKGVEDYYLKYQHLPGVPSESEIMANGNDMAKTDVVLLQKIEELTLYIVEQEKKIRELEAIVKKGLVPGKNKERQKDAAE